MKRLIFLLLLLSLASCSNNMNLSEDEARVIMENLIYFGILGPSELNIINVVPEDDNYRYDDLLRCAHVRVQGYF